MRLPIFRSWQKSKKSGGSSDWNPCLITLALGIFLIYLAFLPPGIYSIDGNSMLEVANSLVLHHSVSIPPGFGKIGRDGKNYSSWYPLLSFLAVPLVAVGAAAAHVAHLPVHNVEAIFALILPPLFTAATIPFVYLIAKALGSSDSGGWLAAVTYAFGTIAMVYNRDFFAEPLLALLIAAALYFVFKGNLSLASFLAACAVLAKPTGILVGLVLSFYLVLKRRSWDSLLPAVGSGLGLAAYFAYNFYRFGNPFTFGQPWDNFSMRSIPEGFAGMLVSPGAGLLWFCPCVFLAFMAFRKTPRRLEALAIVLVLAAFVGLHSFWSNWTGGWSWGPRFLLPTLPGLVALAGILQGKWQKTLAVLAVAGFLINAPNLFSFYERYLSEANENGITSAELKWVPVDSPLVHAWPAALRQVHDANGQDVAGLFRERTGPADTIASSRALRIVAVWWWVLPIAHIPRWIGFATSILLILLGLALAVGTYPRGEATPRILGEQIALGVREP